MAVPSWSTIEADLAGAAAQAALARVRLAGLEALPDLDEEIGLIANGKRLHDASGLAGRALRRVVAITDRDMAAHDSAARLLRRASRPSRNRPAVISRQTTLGLLALRRYQEAFRRTPGAPDRGRTHVTAEAAPAILASLRDELTAFAASIGLAPRP